MRLALPLTVSKRAGQLARALVTVVLVALLLRLVDLRSVTQLIASADMSAALGALTVAFADRLLMIGKWYPLLRVQDPSISLLHAAQAYWASGFASLFLPTAVGADVLRAVALGRGRAGVVEVGASIVAERMLGLIASGVFASLALVIATRSEVPLAFLLPWALAAVTVSVAVGLVPLSGWARAKLRGSRSAERQPRWMMLAHRFGSAYAIYHGHRPLLLSVAALTLLEQSLPVVVLWALSRALHLSADVKSLIVAVPLTLFLARLPISVAAIGVTEGGLVYLLSLFGIAPSAALALALAGRVVELIVLLPGVLWWRDLADMRTRLRAATPESPGIPTTAGGPPSAESGSSGS